jgi:hypothetical protein
MQNAIRSLLEDGMEMDALQLRLQEHKTMLLKFAADKTAVSMGIDCYDWKDEMAFLGHLLDEIVEKRHIVSLTFRHFEYLSLDFKRFCYFLERHKILISFTLSNLLIFHALSRSILKDLYANFDWLSSALSCNQGLKSLDLHELNLPSSTMIHLLQLLKSLKKLKTLSLYGNQFTKEDLFAISNVVKSHNKFIRNVDFSHNNFSQQDEAELVANWKDNYSVVKLYFFLPKQPGTRVGLGRPICERNEPLRWRNMRPIIIDLFIALAPLDLPLYTMLWIFDWLEPMSVSPDHRHYAKVYLLEKLINSRRTVLAQRRIDFARINELRQ